MNSIREMIAQMAASIAWDPAESELLAFVLPYLTAVTRIVLPALAVLVLFRAVYSLFKSKNEPELWGWLMIEGGSRLAINHLENIIGRGVSADIIINLPVISRNHATLIRDKDGGWTLTNISGKANVYVNGEPIESCSVSSGDEITLAGTSMMLAELSDTEEALQRKSRTMPGRELKVGHTLLIYAFAGRAAMRNCRRYGGNFEHSLWLCMADNSDVGELDKLAHVETAWI